MKALLHLAMLTISAAPVDHPRTYLLSVGKIPLRNTESITAFAVKTWGVQFRSICRIPSGWQIRAGSSATPDGVLEGSGSQGATWFNRSSPRELRAIALVTLNAPIQRFDIGSPGNGVPATFKGKATLSTDHGDVRRVLSYRNITLVPATRCPTG